MRYDLALADKSYSSWSMRIGLLVDRFNLPVTCHFARMYEPGFKAMLAEFLPARTVPALRTPEGVVVTESMAIAEELATRFPDAGLWPADPGARGVARGLAAEMHAGFHALRSACPMNLRVAYQDVVVSAEVRSDLDRLEEIWRGAREVLNMPGPWLCGSYSIADAFFAPVAARIVGYGLTVGAASQEYVTALLSEPAFQRWRTAAVTDGPDQPTYDLPYKTRPWPAFG